MARLIAALFALALVAAACGDDDAPVAADGPDRSSEPGYVDGTVHRGTATVLESPDHGPQLCGNVADSYPPQCGGPDIVGWDWDEVDGAESANGVTWGAFEVTGTWDAEAQTLTLTEAPGPPGEWNRDDVDLTSPCPEPAGGWMPEDPATTTAETMDRAFEVARSLPGYAGSWIDQSPNPAMAEGADPAEMEAAANDPELLVLDVLVTDDPEGAEAAIRAVWGGALCVSEASHTEDELRAIQDEVVQDFRSEMVGAGIDTPGNQVTLHTYVATDALRAELEARYGDAVEIEALLRPVD